MCGHSEQIDEADQEGKFYHAFEIHARVLSMLLDKKNVMCLGSLQLVEQAQQTCQPQLTHWTQLTC